VCEKIGFTNAWQRHMSQEHKTKHSSAPLVHDTAEELDLATLSKNGERASSVSTSTTSRDSVVSFDEVNSVSTAATDITSLGLGISSDHEKCSLKTYQPSSSNSSPQRKKAFHPLLRQRSILLFWMMLCIISGLAYCLDFLDYKITVSRLRDLSLGCFANRDRSLYSKVTFSKISRNSRLLPQLLNRVAPLQTQIIIVHIPLIPVRYLIHSQILWATPSLYGRPLAYTRIMLIFKHP
jgi:hypothetical protein